MRFKIIYCLILLLISNNISSQKIYYHNLRLTDSDPVISDWNVDKTKLAKNYIKETVDSDNRVIELRFYKNDKLFEQSCYVTPIIKYKYIDNMIIELNYQYDTVLRTELECGDFQKTAYYIEKDKIIRCVNFIVDLDFLREPTNEDDKNYIDYYNNFKKYENGIEEDLYGIIGYGYSFSKMNNVNPKKQ